MLMWLGSRFQLQRSMTFLGHDQLALNGAITAPKVTDSSEASLAQGKRKGLFSELV
jgi:hypothetical protein